MTLVLILLAVLVILALIFEYTNGFHDAANVVATVIATKALPPFVAIVMAAVLNMIGATQISKVTLTLTKGILPLQETSQIMIIAGLLGAIIWNLFTWFYKIPSSSSYALIGGLIGAGIESIGVESILWSSISKKVLLPMMISPVVGFYVAMFFMKALSKHIKKTSFKIFSKLQVLSSAFVALSHGFNDAQKTMAIITLGLFSAGMIAKIVVPLWVILTCALVMALGTCFGGFRIIETVGFKISKLQPVEGFASETSASIMILIAASLGFPLSSTHLIVGSVAGVGASSGSLVACKGIAKKMILAWIFTIPGSSLVAALSLKALKHII